MRHDQLLKKLLLAPVGLLPALSLSLEVPWSGARFSPQELKLYGRTKAFDEALEKA